MKKILIILIIVLLSLNLISASDPKELKVLFQEKAIRGQTSEIIIRAKNDTGIYKTSIDIKTKYGISINKSEFDNRNQLRVILNIGAETKLGENKIIIKSTDERTLEKIIKIIVEDPPTKIKIIKDQENQIRYIEYGLIIAGILTFCIIILALIVIDKSK